MNNSVFSSMCSSWECTFRDRLWRRQYSKRILSRLHSIIVNSLSFGLMAKPFTFKVEIRLFSIILSLSSFFSARDAVEREKWLSNLEEAIHLTTLKTKVTKYVERTKEIKTSFVLHRFRKNHNLFEKIRYKEESTKRIVICKYDTEGSDWWKRQAFLSRN